MEKPQGWASLTRLMQKGSESIYEDPFPSLQGARQQSEDVGKHGVQG